MRRFSADNCAFEALAGDQIRAACHAMRAQVNQWLVDHARLALGYPSQTFCPYARDSFMITYSPMGYPGRISVRSPLYHPVRDTLAHCGYVCTGAANDEYVFHHCSGVNLDTWVGPMLDSVSVFLDAVFVADPSFVKAEIKCGCVRKRKPAPVFPNGDCRWHDGMYKAKLEDRKCNLACQHPVIEELIASQLIRRGRSVVADELRMDISGAAGAQIVRWSRRRLLIVMYALSGTAERTKGGRADGTTPSVAVDVVDALLALRDLRAEDRAEPRRVSNPVLGAVVAFL